MDMQASTQLQALLIEAIALQKRQLAQSARLLECQQQENAQLRQQLGQATAALQQVAQRLEAGGARLGQDALRVIGTQGQQVLSDSTGQSLGKLNQQVERTTERVKWAERVAGQQSLQLTRAQTTLVWKSLLVLGLGSLLLAGTSAYIAWDRMRVVRQADFGQDILRATQTGALTRCGDALCARIEPQAARHGEDGEYALLAE